MRKNLIYKTIFAVLLWVGYMGLSNYMYPIILTKTAMNQLNDTDTSYASYKLLETVWNYYLPTVLGCFTVLMFRKNIAQVIIKGEKNE